MTDSGVGPQRGHYFPDREQIGVSLTHVEQIRLMRPVRPVADRVGGDHRAEIHAHRVNDARADATAGRTPGDNQCIDGSAGQDAPEMRSEKG